MSVEINLEDVKRVNSFMGYCIGFNSDTVLISQLEVELFDKLNIHLTNAKGLLLGFSINEKQKLIDINVIFEKISSIVNEKCEVVFNTKVDDKIHFNACKFSVLLTGLDEV